MIFFFFFFTSDHLLNVIKDVVIKPGFLSDDSLICTKLFNDDNKANYGKCVGKFNSSLLHVSYYVNMLKQKLLEVTNKLKHVEDKRISWELTKPEIRNVTLQYCIKKKKEFTELEKN